MANLAIVPPQQAGVPCVYGAIAAVSADIARTGIAKDRKNEQQGYKFRGIDDVLNALSPLLAKHRLIILPRVLTRTQTERTTAKGGVLFAVVVDVEFDFISAEDGSKHTVRTFGEGMDSADKATNKAMSAAYKYAAFQTFCIPLEGALDEADKDHHDVAPRGNQPQTHADGTPYGPPYPQGGAVTAPDGFDSWLADLEAVAMQGAVALKEAWTSSSVALRKHLTTTDPARWERIKAGAAQVPA